MFKTDWIGQWAKYSPNKLAIKEYGPERALTYGQLNHQANYMSHLITTSFGIEEGERIMVLAEHCLEYVVLFSMSQKTGITLVPINYRLASAEIDFLIQDSGPRLIIAERKFEHKIAMLSGEVQIVWLEDIADKLQESPAVDFQSRTLDEDHPAFILYTSGSTGFPKGAIYSHKMLLWNSLNTTQSLEISQSDHTINCMPPFHTGGWNVLLTPMLHRGASVGLLRKFDADLLLQLIDREGANLFMGVPTMLKMLSESAEFDQVSLASIRYFIVGGEALPLSVIEKWHHKGVKIRQGYGLTEVGPNLTSLHQRDAARKIGSIGLPNFYVSYQIVDEAGVPVSKGEIGEFCLKGPMVTPGYWGNQEATEKAIVNGYFHTGDLVREDEEGFLYVVDRKKCMFISGGENVYPAEVERVIRECPAVDEVAVIGVEDDRWGEVGKAYFTLAAGANLSLEALKTHCAERLAGFKVPKYFEVLNEIPKNGSGKIDRKSLSL